MGRHGTNDMLAVRPTGAALVRRSVSGTLRKALRSLGAGLISGLFLVELVAGPSARLSAQTSRILPMPCFVSEPDFLKVPAGRYLGDVSAVALDRRNNVWILHRPGTLSPEKRGQALPPVVKFSPSGIFLSAFGGPGAGYEWPTTEHSLALDPTGKVWISGNFRSDPAKADDMLLEFTVDGRFVRQIGNRGASRGNEDTANVHAPGDLAIDWPHHELYVADGYGNRRVAVIDIVSGKFLRSWGAFGSAPTSSAAPAPRVSGAPFVAETGDGPADFNSVHGVAISQDGKVYVSDRNNQRIQVFTRGGQYLGQVFIDRNLPSPVTASGMAFSDDNEQRYIFVADFGNAALVVLDRRRLQVIGRIGGGAGTAPTLTTPHLVASDGRGHLFVAEVAARRVQRLTVRGVCTAK